MAITTKGFAGTVDEYEHARLFALGAHRYAVGSVNDLRVSAVSGQRSVAVAAGAAFSSGVRVDLDALEIRALPAIASGGAWHLVVLRRTWGNPSAQPPTAGTAQLLTLPGPLTTTEAPAAPPTVLPATIASLPGVRDDQPLAWAWVSAGSTSVLLFDMRHLPELAPFRTAAGVRTINTGNTSFNLATPLPAGRFTVPPVVVAQVEGGAVATDNMTLRVAAKTTTSFDLVARNIAAGGIQGLVISWHAVQMTPTTAAG